MVKDGKSTHFKKYGLSRTQLLVGPTKTLCLSYHSNVLGSIHAFLWHHTVNIVDVA
jgi:hypothetical protein